MHAVRTSDPANTTRRNNGAPMPGQRRRRWASTKTSPLQRVVSAENPANTKDVHGTYTTLAQRRSGTTSLTLVQHCTDATQMSYDCRENM